ncbi:MAG: Nif3-like dinuclear metal center hexameric protein [Chitinivibrionales bacterium]|nr:Nif3-like dinuclear metal center hexameric protein [Chitinivibrionales bacterium]MBD3396564.1 Nif3-like dinuclear metal center hexameric protein [Chitinivibrionales bacterium]
MEKLSKITQYLDTFFQKDRINDSCYNGLQVEGRESVKKIVCAVDAGIETFEIARKHDADMIIVHHGHFWAHVDPSIRGSAKRRLDTLLKNRLSLYACHVPLDVHARVGNNALLLRMLGAKISGPFCSHSGTSLSYWGTLPCPVFMDLLVNRISSKLNTVCTVLPYGKEKVKTIGVISGGGGRSQYMESVRMGLDLFITGESTDMFHDVRDDAMNVIFAGHHATETLGVKELAKLLRKRFRVKTEYIDIPTGL